MPDRVPPGRAGRLWLIERLAAARRGAELLDRKRKLLALEENRLAALRAETAQRWEASCTEAERWGLRCGELGGIGDLTLAAGAVAGRARVEVAWRNTMGVRHPDDPRCELPLPAPAELAAGNSALRPAAHAYRQAIEAGVAHAVADASHRRVAAELAATKRQVRGIERHRIPALEESLLALELHLEELEREERVVTRWAKSRQSSR